MSITSMSARMGMAEKLDIPQLTKAVQDGTVPSYIGIPLIQQKMQESQQAKAMMMPKAPPIAQQVLQQAQAMQGVPALPSNMPQEYAQGGILHYAEGDLVDDEDYDEMMYDDQMSEAQKQIGKLRNEMMSNQAEQSAGYGGIDYNEAPNPQVEYHRAPNMEAAKVTKGTPSNFESMALARGKAHGVDESLVKHVMHKETGGLKDRANAVSPAGAIGVMQLMPKTAKDLGVKNPYDPEQNIEGGVKYLAQLQRKYHDPKLTAIAYNWGPGNTDKWLAAGADPSRLPRETRGYIQNMAGGGEVQGYAGPNGSLVDDDDYTTIKGLEAGTPLADARRRFAEGVPKKKGFKTPSVRTGDLSQEAMDRLEAQDLTGVSGLQAGTRYADAMAAIPKAPAPISRLPTGNAGITYAPNTGIGNVMPSRYTAPPSNERESEMMRAVNTPFRAIGSGLSSLADRFSSMYSGNAGIPSDTDYMASGDLSGAIMGERNPTVQNPAVAPAPTKPASDSARLAQIYNDQRALGNTALGKSQPFGDIDLGATDRSLGETRPVASTSAAAPAVEAGSSEIDEIKNLLRQRGEGLSKQKDIDNYMSLLSAGLGMMGGTSPFAAANIGQGAQAGISHALQAGRTRAADENALLSGRLGLYKYQQSAEANKMNKEYLQEYRTEQNRLKELGLTDARAKAVAEQEIKRLALHKDRLAALERSSNAIALSKLKTGFTDTERDKAVAESIARLHNDPGYQEDYKAIYGRLPPMVTSNQNIRKFDNSFGKKD